MWPVKFKPFFSTVSSVSESTYDDDRLHKNFSVPDEELGEGSVFRWTFKPVNLRIWISNSFWEERSKVLLVALEDALLVYIIHCLLERILQLLNVMTKKYLPVPMILNYFPQKSLAGAVSYSFRPSAVIRNFYVKSLWNYTARLISHEKWDVIQSLSQLKFYLFQTSELRINAGSISVV